MSFIYLIIYLRESEDLGKNVNEENLREILEAENFN